MLKLKQILGQRQALWWLVAFSWMLLIYFLSNGADRPGLSLLGKIPFGDKLAHATAFGILAALIYQAIKRPILALVLTSLYGASDEIHQHFVAGRSSDIFDWLADTLGAIIVLSIIWFWNKQRKNQKK